MNEIKVSTENVHKAFHAAGENPEIQELLINLFGKENVEPEQSKDVTERIKTFEDACNELTDKNGAAHIFIREFNSVKNTMLSPELEAFYKLRIICTALNEGWTPEFTEDEWRYYPWFYLYTQEELNDMEDSEKKERRMIDTGDYQTAYAGFGFACSYSAPSNTYAYLGSRFCLKSSELAVYCGKQFIELWVDFNLIRK